MRSALLQLLRPANVVTALADVLAGAALARATDLGTLPYLLGATAGLYAGGIVLNDVFDRRIDRVERPERPIPSGRIHPTTAALLGALLLVTGVTLARAANPTAGLVGTAVALAVLLYDAAAKRHAFLGPLTMGLCRGLNLLLGVAIVPTAVASLWPLAGLAVVYIAAVTMVSRGEVGGGRRPVALAATALISLVVLVLLLLPAIPGALSLPGAAPGLSAAATMVAVVLAGLLAWRVLPAFLAASRRPDPATIRNAVRRGVLSLVLLDAALAAHAGRLGFTLAVLATGVVAGRLARLFAVT